MARNRPIGARRRSFGRSLAFRIVPFLACLVSGYLGLTGAAMTPMSEAAGSVTASQTARLSYSGSEPVITGSVATLFETSIFSGPNQALKTDRQRPQIDVAALSKDFDATRERLSAIREAAARKLPFIDGPQADETPLALAAASPDNFFAALAAIDRATEPSIPVPSKPSESLAYARANAPATVFDTPVSMRVSAKQLNCLATAIYFEARGESYRGQVAVAQVVMNRVKHSLYPDTICSVVFENHTRRNACQFSFACDGIPERVTEKEMWAQAEEIAEKVTRGDIYLTEVGNATHYHATYVYPHWAPRLHKMTKIGLHVFYRFRSS